MRRFLIAMISSLWALTVMAGTAYQVDTGPSVVKWVGKKVGSQHNGTLKIKSGSFDISDSTITGSFLFDMDTIKNLDVESAEYKEKLEGHLRSPDFFAIKEHPTATFALTSAKKLHGNTYQFTGNLTIKNITNPLSFKGDLTQTSTGANLVAQASFDRTKFNIKYNSKKFFDLKTLGDKLILDDIDLELNIVAVKGKSS